MIFVTVGTHEQPFDRLLREVDAIAARAPELDFFCQAGYASYEPSTDHVPAMTYSEMRERVATAEIVVTHGGPGSIIPLLVAQKRSVLVPRLRRYGEHVDDHQVAFCRRIEAQYGIAVVTDMANLEFAIRTSTPPSSRAQHRGVAVGQLRALIDDHLKTKKR